MSGPLKIKVTDRTMCVAPPHTVKEWTDVSMIVFDFTSWLGPDQQLVAASDVSLLFNPEVQVGGTWVPFPGGCCSCCDPPEQAPVDLNPMIVQGLQVLPGNKKVGLSLAAGTPGFAYLASFITTAAPYPRKKEVGLLMSINGFVGEGAVAAPPTSLPSVYDIYFTTALANSAEGDINIRAGGITITLPLNPVRGQSLWFKDVIGVAASSNITIARAGTQLIDGATTRVLNQNYQSIDLYWTGTDWGVRGT